MKMIKITNSEKEFIVDDEDHVYVSRFKWYLNTNGYIHRQSEKRGEKVTLFLSSLLIQGKKNTYISYKNGDKLDNRKENLFNCWAGNKIQKGKKGKNLSSMYKGVSYDKNMKKWVSKLGFNYKTIHLGYFHLEIDAAKAYNKKALELFSEFAYQNEII